MKKLLSFGVALLTLLMVGCDPFNRPIGPGENPDADTVPPVDVPGSEDWFEDQTQPHDSVKVEIKQENLYGIWHLYAEALSVGDVVSSSSSFTHEGNEQQYLEMREDKTCTWYIESGVEDIPPMKANGTWSVENDSILFVHDANSEMAFAFEDGKVWVSALETERFVFASITRVGEKPNAGQKDQREKYYHYFIFHRIDKLPEYKVPMNERLLANPWRIVSDLKQTIEGGEVVSTESDLQPQNTVLDFEKGTSRLHIKDAEGGTIGELSWQWTYVTDSIMYIRLSNNNDWGNLYGFPSELEFKPNFEDNTKASLEVNLDKEFGQAQWNWGEDKPDYTRYVYQLQAVR